MRKETNTAKPTKKRDAIILALALLIGLLFPATAFPQSFRVISSSGRSESVTTNLAQPAQTSAAVAQTTVEWIVLKSGAQANAASGGTCTAECQEQLARAKAATAHYHNESKALEDGFISTFQCVEVPGLGAMGVHYINPLRMMDTSVESSQPETLLFIRQNDGLMRLVGLEYYAPLLSNGQPWLGGPNNPPPVIDNSAPVLFGQTFDGPMPGHGPGQPWHYSLHVWAWRHNPRGLFFPFNPKLSC